MLMTSIRSRRRILALAALALLSACAGEKAGENAPNPPSGSDPPSGSNPSASAVRSGEPSQTPDEPAPAPDKLESVAMETEDKMPQTDEEWREKLTPEQYRILREAGTERAFGDTYQEFKKHGTGVYRCAGCGARLFSSNERFDSGCGWPSFYDPADAENVVTHEDRSLGTVRVEVRCARCDGHLGHVFKGEGFPTPTDLRYCINGIALEFEPAQEE